MTVRLGRYATISGVACSAVLFIPLVFLSHNSIPSLARISFTLLSRNSIPSLSRISFTLISRNSIPSLSRISFPVLSRNSIPSLSRISFTLLSRNSIPPIARIFFPLLSRNSIPPLSRISFRLLSRNSSPPLSRVAFPQFRLIQHPVPCVRISIFPSVSFTRICKCRHPVLRKPFFPFWAIPHTRSHRVNVSRSSHLPIFLLFRKPLPSFHFLSELLSFLINRVVSLAALEWITTILPMAEAEDAERLRRATERREKRSRRREARVAEWVEEIRAMFDEEFEDTFRITREVLDLIAERMAYPMSRFVEVNEVPLSLCCLIPIKYFASAMTFHDLGLLFGLPPGLIHRIVDAFLVWFSRKFKRDWVQFPTEDVREEMALDFRAIKGVPNVIGAIDGTHIELRGMEAHCGDYYNRKQVYSVQLQVTCDSKGVIWDYNVGNPGSMHDQGVFSTSDLHGRLESGEIAPYRLVGDAAYPLKPYMLTPLHAPRRRLMKKWEQTYNYVQSATRMVVERTIGALKGRWRLFARRNESKLWRVCAGTACIIILHNMLQVVSTPRMKTHNPRRFIWAELPNGWWTRSGMDKYEWQSLDNPSLADLRARRHHFGKHIHRAHLRRHRVRTSAATRSWVESCSCRTTVALVELMASLTIFAAAMVAVSSICRRLGGGVTPASVVEGVGGVLLLEAFPGVGHLSLIAVPIFVLLKHVGAELPPVLAPLLALHSLEVERDRGGRTEERRGDRFTAMLLLAPPLPLIPHPPLPSLCLFLKPSARRGTEERDRGEGQRWADRGEEGCEIHRHAPPCSTPALNPPSPSTLPMLVSHTIGQERDRGGRTEERGGKRFTAMLLLAPPLPLIPHLPLPSVCLFLKPSARRGTEVGGQRRGGERDRGGRTEERRGERFTAMLLLAPPPPLIPHPPLPSLCLSLTPSARRGTEERDRGGRTEERGGERFTAMLLLAPPMPLIPHPPLPSVCLFLKPSARRGTEVGGQRRGGVRDSPLCSSLLHPCP
ncbi:unnamed protein product [Closterium sp. NIES-64]|nr:unnamed protein product [Closterium sp. NIES-64]